MSDGQASPIRRFEYQQYAQNRVNKMRTNTTMKLTALAAAIGFVMSGNALAVDRSTADQEVPYEITANNNLAVSATATSLLINSAVTIEADGSREATGTANWSVDTNSPDDLSLSAELIDALPIGVTLYVASADPNTGTAADEQALALTSEVDIVTGIQALKQDAIGLTYRLVAQPTAEPGTGSLTVTYTLKDAI
ncbi:hypothetical protein [Thiocapsa sp.]|uniref:hypothetical protein n=1 Tax=Thiocapsa sp. TaxID=2024551 RepID=UPI0035947903